MNSVGTYENSVYTRIFIRDIFKYVLRLFFAALDRNPIYLFLTK